MTLPPDSGLPAPVQRALPEHLIPERSGVTVWWSNIKREGEWILPRLFRVFTFMRETDAAIDLVAAASDDGFPCYPWFRRDPCLESIQSHPRFTALMNELEQRWGG